MKAWMSFVESFNIYYLLIVKEMVRLRFMAVCQDLWAASVLCRLQKNIQDEKKEYTPISFYKNTFYKNIQAEIPEKTRTSIRTYQPQFWAEKCFFFLFRSKLVIVNTKSFYILFNFTSYCNLG